ncbi:hypothetical protein [Endozoicomonas sp. Mp262]|uniref:hypothetical protein n=1 Tax=Endozoicomonas sp. Mp262 TaxID=2919499 RepID=UPI0021DA9D08
MNKKERLEQVRVLFELNPTATVKRAAELIECSERTIKTYRKELGLGKAVIKSKTIKEQYLSLIKTKPGISYKEAASIIGCRPQSILKVRCKLGLKGKKKRLTEDHLITAREHLASGGNLKSAAKLIGFSYQALWGALNHGLRGAPKQLPEMSNINSFLMCKWSGSNVKAIYQ